MKNLLAATFSVFMAIAPALPVVALSTVATAIFAPAETQALPVDRAVGRQNARHSRQTGRQISRARWRGYHVLPRGAAAYSYGGFRYYRVGPQYYYPYMYGGKTVYVVINVSNGYPVAPPAAGSIDIDFN